MSPPLQGHTSACDPKNCQVLHEKHVNYNTSPLQMKFLPPPMYYSQLQQCYLITMNAGKVVDETVGSDIVKLKPRPVEAAALLQSDIDDGSPGVRSSVAPDTYVRIT